MRRLIFLTVIPAILAAQLWVEPLGLENTLITSLGIYNSIIVVGTAGDGVFYQYADNLPDSGWINIGLEGKDVRAVWPHFVGGGPFETWGVTVGIFPEGGDSTYIYCSTGGREFIPNSAGISDTLAEGIYDIAGFPFTESICGEKYAATGGALYRQLLGDSLWMPVYVKQGLEGEGVIHVTTREDVGGLVLAGGSEGITGILLIKSTDFGDTWEYLNPPGPTVDADFGVDSTETDMGTIFVAHPTTISRSIDGGESWEDVYPTYGCDRFSDLIYEPSISMVFAAGGDCQDTSGTVLVFSGDLGDSWGKLALDLGGPITGLALGRDGDLYFAAPYSGVYRIIGDLSTGEEFSPIPSRFDLVQPYPNPFNPATTIEFSMAQGGFVILTVYDLLGREVETILNKPMNPGHHKILWNANDIPSGIYFVRMEAGQGFTQTRKVTVLR